MENLNTPNCIRTNSGIYMNVFEPTIEMINIEDIAHSLSNQCRFAGHLPKFYSVAQHSILCSSLVDKRDKLEALLHDASEAYIIDIPTPIKAGLTNYKEIEDKLMRLIAQKFNFNYPLGDAVKKVDKKMLHFEWDHLMLEIPLEYGFISLSPTSAKQEFLNEFYDLTRKTSITFN